MREKIILSISIGCVALILSMVMFTQFKTIDQTDIVAIETMRETELRSELASWKEKCEEIETKLNDTNSKIQEYQAQISSEANAKELLKQEFNDTQKFLGYTDVQGEGIIITLEDNSFKNIERFDLISLVNELKLAGAEAISINDQRITNASEIVNVAITDVDKVILVNTKRISSPYVIKAIGSQQYLESALTTKTVGYLDLHSEKDIKIERQNNIKILKYTDNIKIKYAQDREEE